MRASRFQQVKDALKICRRLLPARPCRGAQQGFNKRSLVHAQTTQLKKVEEDLSRVRSKGRAICPGAKAVEAFCCLESLLRPDDNHCMLALSITGILLYPTAQCSQRTSTSGKPPSTDFGWDHSNAFNSEQAAKAIAVESSLWPMGMQV